MHLHLLPLKEEIGTAIGREKVSYEFARKVSKRLSEAVQNLS